MIHELDVVALARSLPEHGLEAGDVGTVVMVQGEGRGYEVEFATLNGDTIAVASAGLAGLPIARSEAP